MFEIVLGYLNSEAYLTLGQGEKGYFQTLKYGDRSPSRLKSQLF